MTIPPHCYNSYVAGRQEAAAEAEAQLDAVTKERDALKELGDRALAGMTATAKGFKAERDALAAKLADLCLGTHDTTALRAQRDALAAENARLRALLERWIGDAGGLRDCDGYDEGHDGGYDCGVCDGHMNDPDHPDLDSGHSRDCVQLLSCQLLHAEKP